MSERNNNRSGRVEDREIRRLLARQHTWLGYLDCSRGKRLRETQWPMRWQLDYEQGRTIAAHMLAEQQALPTWPSAKKLPDAIILWALGWRANNPGETMLPLGVKP